ncbi:ATP synthase subunit s, mitochondrial-like [Hydractinia symbiolongicarpus]|uniref:ATP synthase subunit s, mitochondrial-like n=1 Tax=Hydractinia symbiolongicarpus TaxID=13093 RepID=UPI00254D4D93|nr:ATP synthase subunit s, mitochondrial-like [Hydractinia symbiolongicarpus]
MAVVLNGLLKSTASSLLSRRLFYSWLIEVFNTKDVQRVKKVGPDRAASEWILRNGGKVKFSSSITWISNYGGSGGGSMELVGIDANGVALTNSGLQHLVGLKYLRYLSLHGCKHITDLEHLTEVADTLEYLDIGNCTGLSDVTPVGSLLKLQTLIMTGTLGGIKRKEVLKTLHQKLPSCNIIDDTAG